MRRSGRAARPSAAARHAFAIDVRSASAPLPANGIPLFSPHDLRHRLVSLLHLRGVSWARIGEQVGQRNLAVTANTYSHVLTDERELDYEGMLR